jgi:NAD(P)-dependent dehydrogenase (short-subunit alcohol dehydrogenase family)
MRLDGKVALVTGGTGVIGAAIARCGVSFNAHTRTLSQNAA